jgi:TPR repeat protein
MSSHITHKCAAEGCSEDGSLQCARCKHVFYCGKSCQSKSWQLHKGPCKEAAKAKEETLPEKKSEKSTEKAKEAPPLSFSGVFCAAGCGLQRGNPNEVPQFYNFPQFFRCDRCLGAFYCSRDCQLKAWPEHKGPCKKAVEAMAYMGTASISDTDKLIAQAKQDAEAGNAMAQFNLGCCYDKGTGVAKDMREAIKWYKRAAEAGNTNAQYNLGNFYKDGEGIEVNKSEAVKWYKLSAEKGCADAQCNLGYCYEKGIGVAVDMFKAFKWYKRAAEAGNMTAQYNLGDCYELGNGIDVNNSQAFKWYKLSAHGGFPLAQYVLGCCYANGVGIGVNMSEALKWYTLAADGGDNDAIKAKAILLLLD